MGGEATLPLQPQDAALPALPAGAHSALRTAAAADDSSALAPVPRAEAGPVWLRYQRRPVYSAPCVGLSRFGLWDALGVTRLTGKLEALAILLQKLKSEGRRVLILSQMVLMLDILEMFLNFHYLTYIRIDENANSEQR